MSYAPVTSPQPAPGQSSTASAPELDPLRTNPPTAPKHDLSQTSSLPTIGQAKAGSLQPVESGQSRAKEVQPPTDVCGGPSDSGGSGVGPNKGKTMKGFQVKSHAHPSKIKISHEVPVPECTDENHILVDVYAAGLNFFDILQSQGRYQNQPPLPFVLGTEFSGRVVGESVPRGCPFKIGDRIFGAAQGAYGERVVADWRTCVPVPEGLGWEEAAGVYITYPTSYEALKYRAACKAGEWVLVHAGAGGVGLAACQIAKALGCKVIATASSASKRAVCKEKGGADHVVDYGSGEWQKEVMKITNGHGVDVVYDPVGLLVPSLKVAAWGCRLLVIGFAAGSIEKVPANLVLLKGVSIVGVHWGATLKKDPNHVPQVWQEIFQLLSERKIHPVVYDRVYEGLEEVGRGLADLEGRKTWGKAVVRVRRDEGEHAKGSSGTTKTKAKL